ncbi:MAG: hypothetical protein KA146_02375 [Leptospiraceae bacterium]|nr:hypothetical protein [Leptospiraceae bacterium]
MRILTMVAFLLFKSFVILANDDLKQNPKIYPYFEDGEKINCPSESWQKFRAQYTDNVQNISIYPNGENNFTIIVSEPPPELKQDDFSVLIHDSLDTYYYCDSLVGEDGRNRDVIFEIVGKPKAAQLISAISQKMYGKYSSGSSMGLENSLQSSEKKASMNLSINSNELLHILHFSFADEIGTISKPNYKFFYETESRVIEPQKKEREGIILFRLNKNESIKNTQQFKEEFRLFSLKTDILIGAITIPNSNSVLLIGRKRQIPGSDFPPMRNETFLRIAKVAKEEKAVDEKIKRAMQIRKEYEKYPSVKEVELNKALMGWCRNQYRKPGILEYFVFGNKESLLISFVEGSLSIKGYHLLSDSAYCFHPITKARTTPYFSIYEKEDLRIQQSYSDLQMEGGLLNQSFERKLTENISSFGKQKGEVYSDITPNYLTDYTNDTEIGQALTIADMHLKGRSEEGKVEYKNYIKFPKVNEESVFETVSNLGLSSIIYNWNGKGKFTKSSINKLFIYTMNSTGAMNASFIVMDKKFKGQVEIEELEKHYNERFNNSRSYTLANIVKYNFLKEVFKDNNISALNDRSNVESKLYDVKRVCKLRDGTFVYPWVNLLEDKGIGRIKEVYEEILSKGKRDNKSWIVTPTIIRSKNSSDGIGGHNNDVPFVIVEYTTSPNVFSFEKDEMLGKIKFKLSENFFEFEDEIKDKVLKNPKLNLNKLKSEFVKRSRSSTRTKWTAKENKDSLKFLPAGNKDEIYEMKANSVKPVDNQDQRKDSSTVISNLSDIDEYIKDALEKSKDGVSRMYNRLDNNKILIK